MTPEPAVGGGCDTARVDVVALEELVEHLTAPPGRAERLAHLEVLPARPPRHADWPGWADPGVVQAWRRTGVDRPWSHQREAADLLHGGTHTVVSTGTASGKSLCYLLPALTDITASRGERGQRGCTVLYLSPTKALAQDQLSRLRALGVPGLRATTHDGDSPPEQREWTRDHAEYVLTNPDMLHRSLLPAHHRWSRFLGSLGYVVVDECPPLPRCLRVPRGPGAAPAAARVRVVRRPSHVPARLRHDGGPVRHRPPADRARRGRGDR